VKQHQIRGEGENKASYLRALSKELRERGELKSATDWHSAPDPAEWRNDHAVSKLYGEYVFWLMHHDGTASQRREADKLQKALDAKGFNGWGMAVYMWPMAAKAYNALCLEHGVEPEATR